MADKYDAMSLILVVESGTIALLVLNLVNEDERERLVLSWETYTRYNKYNN